METFSLRFFWRVLIVGDYIVNIYVGEELVLKNTYVCHSGFDLSFPHSKVGRLIRWEVLGPAKSQADQESEAPHGEIDTSSSNTWSELSDLQVLVSWI